MHYQKFFEANKLNLRKTWEGIREVINIKKAKDQIVNALNNGEDMINENNKIAEKFNNHFKSNGTVFFYQSHNIR